MSELIVEVCKIDEIRSHSNADKLEIAIVKGWSVITQKGKYKAGDLVVHVPPDTILTEELSEQLEVTKYLSKQRVKAVRLRGEMSFGLIFEPPLGHHQEGTSVVDFYKMRKWEPPEESIQGDSEVDATFFVKYTSIENYRNFPLMIAEGEDVIITEKIHGTNSRVGYCFDTKAQEPIFMIGSHNRRRKIDVESLYHKPLTDNVKSLLKQLYDSWDNCAAVILYGEIYGRGIQDLGYDIEHSFAAFDIKRDDHYFDYSAMKDLCDSFEIPTVPVLYRGPFSKEILEKYYMGTTIVGNNSNQIREGVVVKPTFEHRNARGRRVILKMISDDYLVRKDGTERH